MGQKVNPHGLRVGIIKKWDSTWYADKKDFADLLAEDHKIREFLMKRLAGAGVSRIEIERDASDRVKIAIRTAKPGIVIGKGGAEIEKVKKDLAKVTDKKVVLDIREIKRPDRDAQLVAENIAQQLENRISFRRAMKSCMNRTMKAGALGVKTDVLAVLIWLVQSSTAKVLFRFRHCVLTLITALQRPTRPTEKSALSAGSTSVRFFRRRLKKKGVLANADA